MQDYDFGQAPVLVTACDPAKKLGCRQQLVVGQKAGIVWALSPDSGAVHWWRQVRVGARGAGRGKAEGVHGRSAG